MKISNLVDLAEHFSDNQTCIDYISKLRWEGQVKCEFCGHEKVYELKGDNRRFKCAKCRKQFSAIKDTIFDNTGITLQKWFMAIYVLSASNKRSKPSSVQLAIDLDVTQKTAWFMITRINYALEISKKDGRK